MIPATELIDQPYIELEHEQQSIENSIDFGKLFEEKLKVNEVLVVDIVETKTLKDWYKNKKTLIFGNLSKNLDETMLFQREIEFINHIKLILTYQKNNFKIGFKWYLKIFLLRLYEKIK